MESIVELRLLGPVQVKQAGEPVRGFESHKALALLCYLAERRNPVPRSHLADLFWYDKPDSQGRANLSRVLHNNATLLPDCFQSNCDSVQFRHSAKTWVDVIHFEELTAQNDLTSLTAAVELYQDDFMTGFQLKGCPDFESWLVTEQERWRQRLSQVLDSLIQLHCHQGNYRQGLNLATRLLALDPWREEAHRQLMLLLALSGQRSAALVQYDACRRILAEALGVEPATGTTALYQRIRAGERVGLRIKEPGCYGSGFPIRPHNLPTQLPSLNGQEEELVRIIDRLDQPGCRLVALVGPDGVGKISLALHAAVNKLESFRHGVYYVPLTAVNSTDIFICTVADTLKCSLHDQHPPKVQLINHLREKETLLVMANFEPFVGGARLLDDILKRAPRVKILVTAREPVNLYAECIFDIWEL